jgi:SAM-dependent methyltransferase
MASEEQRDTENAAGGPLPPTGFPTHDGAQESEWFDEWFRSDFYLKLYSHRDREEAEACVDLILRSVTRPMPAHGPPHALDLACGPGRHAITLAERGFAVTAVDLSPTLLAFAASQALEAGADIRFIRSDMREIDFLNEFDLVLQLFTSFGYFDDHADDYSVLQRVRASLRHGGFYALDLINERRLRRTLIPRSVKSVDGTELTEERRIVEGRVEKTICIHTPDGRTRKFVESVQLYSPETIEGMLYDTGMAPLHWFGGYDGTPFNPETSERMLVVSQAL